MSYNYFNIKLPYTEFYYFIKKMIKILYHHFLIE